MPEPLGNGIRIITLQKFWGQSVSPERLVQVKIELYYGLGQDLDWFRKKKAAP